MSSSSLSGADRSKQGPRHPTLDYDTSGLGFGQCVSVVDLAGAADSGHRCVCVWTVPSGALCLRPDDGLSAEEGVSCQ